MNLNRPALRLALGLCFSLLLLQGCVKDSYKKTYTYTYYKPVYRTTAEVRANIRSNAPRAVERPGKIYLRGNYIFLNEMDRGIHVIDNSNPSQPQNVAFIDVPGNLDIAVKGNTLYADLFTDLVAIDITNPHQVALKKVVEDIFPNRVYDGTFRPDSTKVIAGWEKRDTTITETSDLNSWLRNGDVFISLAAVNNSSGGSAASSSPYGVGGSMARFAVVNERLYTVSTQALDVFNISNTENPQNIARRPMGWNIETIYPFMDKLFIGSSNGMFIYSIANPDNPVQLSQFAHVESCDPVVADQQYAYVTLRSGTMCRGIANQLDVIQLNNLTNPSLVKTYSMQNPHGLSKEGNYLFICDGAAGLKVYNAANVQNLQLVNTVTGVNAYDIITLGGRAILVAKDGLYQYDYTNINNIQLLSKIQVNR